MPYEIFILTCIAFLALSLLGTRALIRILNKKNVLDKPNQRSNHKLPTPRGGGIITVMLLLVAFTLLNQFFPNHYERSLPIAIGMTLLAGISWVDDLRSVSARWRLLTQIFAVGLALFAGSVPGLVFQGLFPLWLDRALTAFLWLWFVNLFNFMDGIDGITGTESASIALGISLIAFLNALSEPSYLYAPLIVAAMLGFLKYNWHPAKIFIGDVGSVSLGYILGWLLLLLAADGYWAAALILPAYYLADSTFTLLKRMAKGERFWEAHSTHFYQQAARAGKSHAQVVGLICFSNAALLGLAVATTLNPAIQRLMIGVAAIYVMLLLYALKPRKKK